MCYLNDGAEDCVCVCILISVTVIGGRVLMSAAIWWPRPSISVTITLSSSAQSITINYHNSGDH